MFVRVCVCVSVTDFIVDFIFSFGVCGVRRQTFAIKWEQQKTIQRNEESPVPNEIIDELRPVGHMRPMVLSEWPAED